MSRGRLGRLAGRFVLVVCVFLVAGALAGWLWEWVWEPPLGVAYQDRWVLAPDGLPDDFSSTGWYVVIAIGVGALVGGGLAWLLPGHELTTLAATCVGGMLAGWLMFTVGHALGPPDPDVLARGRPDLTEIPGDLRLAGVDGSPHPLWLGSSALTAFPGGALLAFAVLALLTHGRRRSAPGTGPRE